jgi:hypothetical protein
VPDVPYAAERDPPAAAVIAAPVLLLKPPLPPDIVAPYPPETAVYSAFILLIQVFPPAFPFAVVLFAPAAPVPPAPILK